MPIAKDEPIASAIATDPIPNSPAELYLDLVKRILTRALVAKGVERHTVVPRTAKSQLVNRFNRASRRFGMELVRLLPSSPKDYLESGHAAENRVEDAETMLGLRQLDHMQRCILDVVRNGVPGDLIETGVWRGGMTIFMRAVLRAYEIPDRRVWVADSFAGLPDIDRQHETFAWSRGDMAVSLDNVKRNFDRYGLLDDRVVFLKGFFSETLPTAPIGRLAILRVDADLYQSTVDVLTNLYARLSPGGYAIFDDYLNLAACRRAIDEFRAEQRIREPVQQIDERAVYWQKAT